MAVSWTQVSFRFRNDDGSETAATWKAALNTSFKFVPSVNFRLRICIGSTGTTSGSFTPQLRYSLNGGAFTPVTASSVAVQAVASSNFADDAATTEQISTHGASTWDAGKMDDDNGAMTSTAVTKNHETEMEWCIQIIASAVANGNTLDFECYDATTALGTYSQIPRITVAIVAFTATPAAFAASSARLRGKVLSAIPSSFSAALMRGRLLTGTLAAMAGGFSHIRTLLLSLFAGFGSASGLFDTGQFDMSTFDQPSGGWLGQLTPFRGKFYTQSLAASWQQFTASLTEAHTNAIEIAATLQAFSANLFRASFRQLAAGLSAFGATVTKQTQRYWSALFSSPATGMFDGSQFDVSQFDQPPVGGFTATLSATVGTLTKSFDVTMSAFAAGLNRYISRTLDASMSAFAAVVGRQIPSAFSASWNAFAAAISKIMEIFFDAE